MKVSSQNQPHKVVIKVIGLLTASVVLSHCGDTFMKQKTVNESTTSMELAATADSAGNFTGAIDPSSKTTQVLRATGSLSGSAIALPPGALGINLNITIGSGETLASNDVSQQLGLGDNTASAAGPAVSFVPSQTVQASSPFTLSIPVTGTSLALAASDSDNLVVMYKWMKVVNGVASYSIGIITRDQLTIGSKAVQFQTDKFGTFQLAVTQTKITAPINVPTSEPPVLKADASNPLVGVWSQCYANSNNSYNNNSTSTSTTTTVNTGSTSNVQTPPTPTALSLSISATYLASGLSVMTNSQARTEAPYTYSVLGVNSGSPITIVSSQPINTTVGGIVSTSVNPSFSSMLSGDQLWVQLSPNCVFVNNSSTTAINDGTSLYYYTDAASKSATLNVTCDDAAYVARQNSGTNTAANTSTNTTTSNNNGGGGKDRLGIPADAGAKYSSREYVKFSTSTFIHSRSLFTDGNCGGNMISRVEETGSYKLGAAKADGSLPISITFATNTGTIFLDQSATFANNNPVASGCGFSDWVVNSPRDLSSSYCSNNKSDGKSHGPSIVQIKGNNIYFDDGGSGVINTKDTMSKQQ